MNSIALLMVYFYFDNPMSPFSADGIIVNVSRKPPPHFGIDVKAIKEAAIKHNAKMVILASPNNPDGSVITREEIEEILELPSLLVLDEAYIEFYGVEHSFIQEVPKRQNLIVLRTFSKRAALAGTKILYRKFLIYILIYVYRFEGWLRYLPA